MVFGGGIFLWILNALASAIRAHCSNMLVPALKATCAGVVLLLPLSPVVIFGFGPIPAFGVAGGGLALILVYALGGGIPRLVRDPPQSRAPAPLASALGSRRRDPAGRRRRLNLLDTDESRDRRGDRPRGHRGRAFRHSRFLAPERGSNIS